LIPPVGGITAGLGVINVLGQPVNVADGISVGRGVSVGFGV